ncbi:MAG: hypothetical protein AB1758_26900, partial [Candidatus Eremiobacterota bacterium]
VTVRDAVERRLAGLDPADLRVARQAAILGRTFEFEVLAGAWDISPEELVERLDRLLQRKVLTEARERGCFTFYNQPILDVLLEGIPGELQLDLHARAARALETFHHQAARLAHHYRLSGQGQKAVIQLVRAGEASMQAYAFLEAVDLFKKAAELPEADLVLPRRELTEKTADAYYGAGLTELALESYTWLLNDARDRLERARLLRKLGSSWERLGDMQQAYRCLKEALGKLGVKLPSNSVLATVGMPFRMMGLWFKKRALLPGYSMNLRWTDELERTLERLTRVLFFLRPEGWVLDTFDITLRQQFIARVMDNEATTNQARLFQGYAIMFFPRMALPRARRMLRIAANMAREMQHDSVQKATFLREAGYLLFTVGDYDNSLRTELQAAELSTRLGDIHGLSQNHSILQLLFRYRGKLDEAREHAMKARDYAEQTSSRVDMTLTSINLGHIAALERDTAAADLHLAEAERRGRKMGLAFLDMLLELARGWAYFAEGSYQDALDSGESSSRQCKLRHAPFYLAESRLLEACALVRLARNEPGLRKVAAARIKMARAEGGGLYSVFDAILRRCEGELSEQAGEADAARDTYLEALDCFEALGNPLEQGNTHRTLADFFAERDPERSRTHAEQASRCFTEAGLEARGAFSRFAPE